MKFLGSPGVECGYRLLGVDGRSPGVDSVDVADRKFTTGDVDGVGIRGAPDGEARLAELVA